MKFSFILLLSVLAVTAVEAKPLAQRIWQLQDYDMKHILRVIDLAPTYGINEVQLSHHIIMDADQILESESLAGDINDACKRAHRNGLKVSIWTHELERVPEYLYKDGKVNLDDPRAWPWLTDKYNKVFDICPEVDGLVLTFHETQVSVYHDHKVTSSLSQPQRVARLIDTLADVCKARGKYLVVRSFCYEPHELQFIKDGFSLAKSDFVVMSKCQPHDWQPYYPHNPLIGNVGGRPQIMEFDSGHEFMGQAAIPYIDIEYTKQRLEYGISKGIIGAVTRIERHVNRAIDTPNWANICSFSRLLQDPTQDPDRLLERFLAERYGAKAAPELVVPLKRSFDIVNKAFFALGFWVTDHSRIPNYNYALGHVDRLGTQKWDSDPKWTKLHSELMSPDSRILRRIATEKSEALRLCRKSMMELEAARPLLSAADYEELKTLFAREEAVIHTWTAYFDVFFSLRAYETSGERIYRSRTERAISRLLECAELYGDELRVMTGDGGADNVQRINAFVDDVRKRLDAVTVKSVSQ